MCKICHNTTKKLQYQGMFFHYCDFCGFLAKDESFLPDLKTEQSRYELHHNDNNLDYYHYQLKFYDDIQSYLGSTSLDYGCGYGHVLADILINKGIKCNYYDKFFHQATDYQKFQYDSIILEEVIEHLANPIPELTKIIRLLKDNGRLIIQTNFLTDRLDLNKWWYLRDLTHVGFYSRRTFEFIGNLFNLRIIYCNGKNLVIFQKA